MAQHQVARMTARKALATLQTEGLTVTRQGAGVFVRNFRPIVRHSIPRLSERQWASGRDIWQADTDARTLEVDRIDVEPEAVPPEEIRVLLGLTGRQRVCSRARRYSLDGKPVLMATSYLPATLVAGTAITRQDTGPGGIYARLAEIGARPAHFQEDLIARMPSAPETQDLQIDAGTPVIHITRTAFTNEAQPVEVNRMILDAGAYVIRYDFDA